ncbi:TPM domain-containing protein [uncultured Clostridium sp.]|uniref:TPM domain-containing protein n=1 Tax=uncultured Clostridium sp. TaxID=59620 RepID=UPI0028EFE617|nr:TPM domain-containing protein [uncultured Clostridium sp.]
MKRKTYLKGILFLIMLLIFLPFVSNVAIAASDAKQRIYDFAGLLTPEEIEELEVISSKYSAKRKTDMVILTSNDMEGKDVVKYMQDFYDEEALGYDKPHGNCAILTIDMENREVYLAGFYLGKEYLDDSRLDLIRSKITPDLSQGDYYKAFHDFIKTSYKYMGIRPGVNPDNVVFNLGFQIIASLATAGIIVGIMAHNSGSKITVNEGTYRDSNNSRIIQRRDDYIRTTVTKVRKPSQNTSSNSSSGGGGGGGGGVTSGGHSHSGSRGSF